MYLKRKIDLFLEEWKNDADRKPLIVKGPRQIGKTESIKRFGELHYDNIIEINFVEEPKAIPHKPLKIRKKNGII